MNEPSGLQPRPIRIARVLVGSVTPTFENCERTDPYARLDVEIAHRQHRLYVDLLEAEVGRVHRVACDAAHPDAVFVEDTLVVLDAERAVLTRPGVESRRGEVTSVARALEPVVRLERMQAPAVLDGGDVLRVGAVLVVGRSARTNAAGAAMLAGAARESGVETLVVSVPRGLHLKSACSLADPTTLVFDPGAALDLAPFRELGLQCVPAGEPLGANVLALGEGRVLVSSAAPSTRALLAQRGLRVLSTPMSELHKADGALTCCSVRLPEVGGWCT